MASKNFSQHHWGIVILVLIFSGLTLAGCCPPNCPIPLLPTSWDESLTSGEYQTIIDETQGIIEQGEEAEFYADALLYRGMAELRTGNIEEASRYLDMAEQYSEKFTNGNYELGRLYQGKMIVSAVFGDIDLAMMFRDRAIEYAPDLRDEILKDAAEYGIPE